MSRRSKPRVVFTAEEAVAALSRTYPERFVQAGFQSHEKVEWTMDHDGVIQIEVQR